MSAYSSDFNHKIINDPIYGCIGLSKAEIELLDSRAMQRLRRIRQMGFSSYVYPSGEHSRFVHSLGVLCVMGKMCDHLYRLYGQEASDSITFSEEDVKKARIAALLHDIGHYPFSHLSESVYSYIDVETSAQEMIPDLSGTSDNSILLLSNIGNFRKRAEKDHEHLGAHVIAFDPEIKRILQRYGLDPIEIGNIIIGDSRANPIHAQLLHSSLDADRLDYLLRDSQQAGVAFGHVELEYIIRQMRIEKCNIRNSDGTNTYKNLVVFDIRGQHAIEHFLMARYFHYTQVVQHKTSAAFEVVAKALLYKTIIAQVNSPYSNYDKIVATIENGSFYDFTDDYVWEMLRTHSENTSDDYTKTLWKCLSQRCKPSHIYTATDIVPKAAAHKNAIPVNDSTYLLARYTIQNRLQELANEVDICPSQI